MLYVLILIVFALCALPVLEVANTSPFFSIVQICIFVPAAMIPILVVKRRSRRDEDCGE